MHEPLLPRLLTSTAAGEMPEKQHDIEEQQHERIRMKMTNVSWMSSDRPLLRHRHRHHRSRDLFITFRQPDVTEKTMKRLSENVVVNDPADVMCENKQAQYNRHLTSPPSRSPTLYGSSVSPQRTKVKVTCSAQTDHFLQRSQMSIGGGVVKGGKGEGARAGEGAGAEEGAGEGGQGRGGKSEHNTPQQLTRGKTSAGDSTEWPRFVGLPGKEWVRLVRANPPDPVLRRFDGCCAPSSGRVEHRSTGSRPESSSGCGSLTGKKFPTVYPLPSQLMRTKPFNEAIGVRNRSTVSSLFQQSCQRIFTSNRWRSKGQRQWIDTGNERLLEELFQQGKEKEKEEEEDDEEEKELRRLAVDRFVPEEREFFTSKTPNNSPAPDKFIDKV